MAKTPSAPVKGRPLNNPSTEVGKKQAPALSTKKPVGKKAPSKKPAEPVTAPVEDVALPIAPRQRRDRREALAESQARKPSEADVAQLALAAYFDGAPPEAADSPWETFLRNLAELPSRKQALSASGLSRQQVAERVRDDRAFAARFLEAWEMGIDSVEDEAVRRAVLGWSEPIYNQGLYCGEVQKFSDTLLATLLKANRRKYRGEDQAAQRGLSEETKTQLRSVFSRALEGGLA